MNVAETRYEHICLDERNLAFIAGTTSEGRSARFVARAHRSTDAFYVDS